MNDPVNIVEVGQTLQDRERNSGHDINIDGADALVDTVQGAFVTELHAYAYVRIRKECAVEGDDIVGVAIVHDLEFPKDLFSHRWLRINQNNLQVMSAMGSMIHHNQCGQE